MGWCGIENGELLPARCGRGVRRAITNDRGLEYEQNLATLPLAVVVLLPPANTLEAIRPMLGELLDALTRLTPSHVRQARPPVSGPSPLPVTLGPDRRLPAPTAPLH